MIEGHTKRRIEFAISVAVPLLALIVLTAEHSGLVDRMRGLDKVEDVANRFDRSYSPDASYPVYPEDAAWRPTLRLIKKYSNVNWRVDKSPQMIARMPATLAVQDPEGHEWTSPSTPFVVIYERVPAVSGAKFNPSNLEIVGSIGDLHAWIEKSRSAFHFLISDVLITALSLIFGYWLFRINYSSTARG